MRYMQLLLIDEYFLREVDVVGAEADVNHVKAPASITCDSDTDIIY